MSEENKPQHIYPQAPIKYKGDYIYPLTRYDQIIMRDGSRWNGSGGGGFGILTATHDNQGNVTLTIE